MADKIKFKFFIFLILITTKLAHSSEFSAEAELSPTIEDASAEDTLMGPQIIYDMLTHKNPAITNNALKELWEKLPEYESIDIK